MSWRRKWRCNLDNLSWFTSWQLPFSFCLLSVSCVCLILLSPPPLSVFLCMGVVSLPSRQRQVCLITLINLSIKPPDSQSLIASSYSQPERYTVDPDSSLRSFSLMCLTCVASLTCVSSASVDSAILPACLPRLSACFAICSSSPAVAGCRYPPSILGAIHQRDADHMDRRLHHYGNNRWDKETLHPPPPALLMGTRDPSTPLFLFAPWYSHCVTSKYHFELFTWVESCVWVQSLLSTIT